MSKLRRLFGVGRAKAPATAINLKGHGGREFIETRLNIPVSKVDDYTAFLGTGSKNVWAAFRACHLTANRLLSTEFKLVDSSGDNEVVDRAGDLTRMLANPNRFDTWEEMLYQWTYHMKLTGNAFWLKDQNNLFGSPLELHPLMPQYMRIAPHPTDKISHYIYRVGAREIRFETDEVIHFRRPHPTSTLWGMGDVEPSQALYSDFINRDTYQEKFFENGASPSGILIHEEAEEDEDEWDKLKKWWNQEYSGPKNIGKTAMMNGKWTYEQLGLSQRDMQSLEKEEMNTKYIFMNMGVPLSIAGMENASNYATARIDKINFALNEVVPLIDMLVGKLNGDKQFVKTFNPAWELAYELSGLIDQEQVAKDYGPAVDRGAMTPNEFREKMGLPRVEDPLLDQYFVNRARVPIEFAGLTDTGSQTAPLGADGEDA